MAQGGPHQEAMAISLPLYGKPDNINTDQGSQFTGAAFTGVLTSHGIAISMDGKGAWRDNVFVEARAAFAINYRGNPGQDGRPAGPALQV
jgi:transposase InsO family protein